MERTGSGRRGVAFDVHRSFLVPIRLAVCFYVGVVNMLQTVLTLNFDCLLSHLHVIEPCIHNFGLLFWHVLAQYPRLCFYIVFFVLGGVWSAAMVASVE